MIEVYDYKYSKGKLAGYIDGKKYLNKKQKLMGYLEGLNYNEKGGETLLILKDNGKIKYSDGKTQGIMERGKISWKETKELIYQYNKEKGEIHDSEGNMMIELKGDISNLNDGDYFGIIAHFLELFA